MFYKYGFILNFSFPTMQNENFEFQCCNLWTWVYKDFSGSMKCVMGLWLKLFVIIVTLS